MSYKCTISLGSASSLLKNDIEGSTERCTIIVKGHTAYVDAKDAVALRAALNSIAKMLIVHEKAGNVK